MSSEKLYASNMNALLQNQSLACPSKVLEEPLWCPNSSTTDKAGVHLESVTGESNAEKDDHSDEDYDGCFQQPGKKRRLSTDQVQFLESNFEVENKLDPEKKVRIAVELGLQPRQVAIWFQNRRARFKTKQLEKDYDCLRASYDKLKTDYDTLLKDNEKMKSEIDSLKAKVLIKDSGKGNREQNFHNVGTSLSDPISEKLNASGFPDTLAKIPVLAWKQEDASSAKSDVFDPDSPHYFNGNNSSFLEPAYSSSIFEAVNNSSFLEPAYSSNVFDSDQSDFSQDDDDNFSKSLLQLPYFPKLEDGIGDLGFPVEDQFLCFWS